MAASVVEIARAVAVGDVRPTDVLEEHVARYRASAPINALVQPRHDAARAEAAAVEAACRHGAGGMPLAGVPVSVKECFAVRGQITSLGIPARRSAYDQADAPLVACLRQAGAVVVGKANVSQAMYLHDADNPVWGRTNHPLDATRGPGGSSGGDAALVAAAVVPLAIGNDLAGSIRQPAHACGIAGFLPRSAVLGDGGGFDTMPGLRVVRPRAGILARHVDDLSLAFAAITGGDAAAVALPEVAQGPLRVAWWDDAGPIEPAPAVRRAVHEAVERLSRAGCRLVRLDGTLAAEAAWLHLALLSADGGADVRRLFGGGRSIQPVARLLRLAGVPRWLRPLLSAAAGAVGSGIESRALRETGPRGEAAFQSLVEARADLGQRCRSLADSFDAAVCPVSALPALRHGTAARLVLAAAPCLLANLLDLAAGSVPVTLVRSDEESGRGPSRDPVVRAADETDRGSGGLPVGVQVIGLHAIHDAASRRSERVVLELMRLIEPAAT
jgi:fatty acid amide hydrolase